MSSFLLAALLLAGCPKAEPGDPTVTITSPTDGETVSGPDVVLQITVENFELVAPDTAAAAGWSPLAWIEPTALAHDPNEPPNGYVEVKLDGTAVADTIELPVTLHGVAAGGHQVQAELYYPDGDSFFPPVTDEVSFTVQ